MELKTDGGIYITKELYRKEVLKIMREEKKQAALGATMFLIEHGGEINKKLLKEVEEHAKDALNLQWSVLQQMEEALFGVEEETPEKKEDKEDV